jgi:hypothetical protein
MQLEISAGAWMSWFLGRRNSTTITTVAQRQTGTPMRPVQGSEVVAMVDRARKSPRSTSPNTPGHRTTSRRDLVTLVITAWSRNSADEPRVCARHM